MSRVLEIALVNNMPDAALAATNVQFRRLVRAGASGCEINWRCYMLPGQPRSDAARRYLARDHEGIEALYRRGADALIVTGSEPRASHLSEEPYWPDLQKLIDRACVHTASTMWSCFAAHAAAWRLAGVERRAEPRKVSGVYQFTSHTDWAGAASTPVTTPHSRHNGLMREELEKSGFQIGSWSSVVGVDMFWREEPSLFVFLQGHPEYDADTLPKEYRRDVLRFLDGDRPHYPELPENVFSAEVSQRLSVLRSSVQGGDGREAHSVLTQILALEQPAKIWERDSVRLFASWLRAVENRSRSNRRTA